MTEKEARNLEKPKNCYMCARYMCMMDHHSSSIIKFFVRFLLTIGTLPTIKISKAKKKHIFLLNKMNESENGLRKL